VPVAREPHPTSPHARNPATNNSTFNSDDDLGGKLLIK
jgi:hypothetical protein